MLFTHAVLATSTAQPFPIVLGGGGVRTGGFQPRKSPVRYLVGLEPFRGTSANSAEYARVGTMSDVKSYAHVRRVAGVRVPSNIGRGRSAERRNSKAASTARNPGILRAFGSITVETNMTRSNKHVERKPGHWL